MSVAICRDDLWLGVKSQSNPEIAGSLRNPFRWSVKHRSDRGGRALDGKGWPKALLIPRKLRIPLSIFYRQTLGAKVQGREGKSPDRSLRSQRGGQVGKDVPRQRQPVGGLGSSHPLKKA